MMPLCPPRLSRLVPACLFSAFLIGVAAPETTSAQVLYQQTFENSFTSDRQFNSANLRPPTTDPGMAGWTSYLDSTGAITTGTTNQPQVQTGDVVWSQPTATAGYAYLYTGATPVDLDLSTPSVEFSIDTVQSSGTVSKVRFLVQEGGQWYASNTVLTPAAAASIGAAGTDAKRSIFLSTAAADWSTFTMTGSGVLIAAALSDLSLEHVSGFGWYSYTSTGRVTRFDNFTVTAVPEPGTPLLLSAGLLGIVAMRRIRRRP